MNKRWVSLLLLVTLLAAIVPPGSAVAQQANQVEFTLGQLNNGEALALSGLSSDAMVNIPLPGRWEVSGDATLTLKVRASELLNTDLAALTIYMNETQLVASLRVTELLDGQHEVAIPARMFRRTGNTLTFDSRLYLDSDKNLNCQDWDSPARWLTIEADSRLILIVEPAIQDLDLAYFPVPFVLPSSIETPVFVLPDQPTDDDLSTLAAINFVFGQQGAAASTWQPTVTGQSQFDPQQAGERNVVIITSGAGAWTEGLRTDSDFIYLQALNAAGTQAGLILGDHDPADGRGPALALADPHSALLLSGATVYVDSRPPAPLNTFLSKFTLAELGYDDRTVRGLGTRSLIYRLYLPYNMQVSSAQMNLVLTHSPALSAEQTVATVYLNGFAVAGVLLSAHSANLEPLQISLPADRLRPGYNFIRFSFGMHSAKATCETLENSLWATVHNTTQMTIVTQPGAPNPDLNSFPQPFNDLPGALLVLPDQVDSGLLERVARLAVLLGEDAYPGAQPPRVVRAVNFDPKTISEKHVILIGTLAQNSALRLVNNLLPQPFNETGAQLQPGYGVTLPDPVIFPSVGTVQLIRSPWATDGRVLALAGTDTPGMLWAWELLLDPDRQAQLAGSVVLVSAGANSLSEGAAPGNEGLWQAQVNVVDVSGIPVVGSLLQSAARPGWLAPALALLVALVVVLVVLFAWRWLSRLRLRLPTIRLPFRKRGAAGKDDDGDDEV